MCLAWFLLLLSLNPTSSHPHPSPSPTPSSSYDHNTHRNTATSSSPRTISTLLSLLAWKQMSAHYGDKCALCGKNDFLPLKYVLGGGRGGREGGREGRKGEGMRNHCVYAFNTRTHASSFIHTMYRCDLCALLLCTEHMAPFAHPCAGRGKEGGREGGREGGMIGEEVENEEERLNRELVMQWREGLLVFVFVCVCASQLPNSLFPSFPPSLPPSFPSLFSQKTMSPSLVPRPWG